MVTPYPFLFCVMFLKRNNNEFIKQMLSTANKIDEQHSKFMIELLNIAKDLKDKNIISIDFLNFNNLGFDKNNNLIYFDIGMSKYDNKQEYNDI